MNVLIIDNETIRLTELLKLVQTEEVTVVGYNKMPTIDDRSFDLIILSGGSSHPVKGNDLLCVSEIDLIKNTRIPIVGICLGFELICYAYGGELERHTVKTQGILEIQNLGDSGVLGEQKVFKVYESHRWSIAKAPNDFVELARSNNGVEAIRHKEKQIYGFQFHPEMFVEKTDGREIFRRVIGDILSARKL